MRKNIYKLNENARFIRVLGLLITGTCWLFLFFKIQHVKKINPTPIAPVKKINALPLKTNNNELALQCAEDNKP